MTKIVNCRGPIVSNDDKWIYDWFEMDAFCPNDLSKAMKEASETNDDILIRINSPGGYVDAAGDMYEEIMASNVHVESRVVANCCSAATYLVCAADEATISPLGQFMIHRCKIGGASGNADDFEAYLQSLNETDKAIALAYSIKTGKSEEEILNMMKKETYMSPQIAVENGFVDRVLYTESVVTGVNFSNISATSKMNSNEGLLTQDIINEMQKNKQNYVDQKNDIFICQKEKAQANLNILKLGGK